MRYQNRPLAKRSGALIGAITACATVCLSQPVNAASRYSIGPDTCVYLPINSSVQKRFGSSWISLGVGFGKLTSAPNIDDWQPSFNVIYQKRGDSHACLIPIGMEYHHNFARSGTIVPYAGAGAAIYITDLRSDIDNVHSGFRSAVGAQFVGGAYVGKTAYVQARLHAVTPVKGFNLSGFELSAGMRF